MNEVEGINIFGWHTNIWATLEEPQRTSLGPWPGNDYLGIALPCVKALRKRVYVKYNGITCYCEVRDVGPFCEDDYDYVFGNARPRAEIMKGMTMYTTKDGKELPTVGDREIKASNSAGIDLMPGTAAYLGITDNCFVDWKLED